MQSNAGTQFEVSHADHRVDRWTNYANRVDLRISNDLYDFLGKIVPCIGELLFQRNRGLVSRSAQVLISRFEKDKTVIGHLLIAVLVVCGDVDAYISFGIGKDVFLVGVCGSSFEKWPYVIQEET